nr:MAG TPA: hypothetical protein [Caudoviricetes sp.]
MILIYYYNKIQTIIYSQQKDSHNIIYTFYQISLEN